MKISKYYAVLAFFLIVFLSSSIYLAVAAQCDDNINLATSSQKLYLNSLANSARASLTKTELPNLLADGLLFTDKTNLTAVGYTQIINLGRSSINYSTSGGDIDDPNLLIQVGIDSANPLFQYIIALNRNINITDPALHGNTIRILGNDYRIGSDSMVVGGIAKLVLFGEDNSKIVLKNDSAAKKGIEETSVYGTIVSLITSNGDLAALKINISMTKATKDYILTGQNFSDPIFGGLVTRFIDVNQKLDDASRDSIKVDTDNSLNAKVTFTSALAGDAGEKTLFFAHDDNSSDKGIRVLLADSANKTIHIAEGENLKINEYMVINVGDYGRIVKIVEIPTGLPEVTSKIQFEDAITDKTIFDGGLTTGSSGTASANIDGQTYHFAVNNNTVGGQETVNVTWGSGASPGRVGSQTTIFPRIKLANGEWLAFLKPQAIVMNRTYVLPGVQGLTTYESGQNVRDNGRRGGEIEKMNASVKFGNINYTISADGSIGTILGIDINEDGKLASGTDCLFNNNTENGAAVLVIEKGEIISGGISNNGDAICIGIDLSDGTSTNEISVAQPVVTGAVSPLTTLTSNSVKKRRVTRYGSLVEYDSTDNDAVTVRYPSTQMYANIEMGCKGIDMNDGDGDGIPDYRDKLLGNKSSVSTNIPSFNIIIGNSENLSQDFSTLQKVEFKEGNDSIVEFNFDFSSYTLNLSNITIEKQSNTSSFGSIIVRGIDLTSQNETKSVLIDNLTGSTGVCIIDADITNITEMSSGCNAANEVWVACPGSNGQYSCAFNATLNKYRISGLNHSAVSQQQYYCGDGYCNGGESCSVCSTDCGSCPAPPGSSGGGGGGGLPTKIKNETKPAEKSNETNISIPVQPAFNESLTNESAKEQNYASSITGAAVGARINNFILVVGILIFIDTVIFVVTILFLIRENKLRRKG